MNYVKKYPWEDEKKEENNSKVVSSFPWDNYKAPTSTNNGTKVKAKETLGGTLWGTAVQLGRGLANFGESATDAILQLGTSKANPYYWFNPDKLKQHQAISQELIEDDQSKAFFDKLGYNKVTKTGETVQQKLDNSSKVKSNNFAGEIVEGIGGQLPSMLLGNLGATSAAKVLGSTIPLAARSFGGGVDEAYKGGATRQQANVYGALNTATELATEYITGGVPGVKTGFLSGFDKLAEKGIGKVSSELLKSLLNAGYKIVGEGAEEALAEIINPLLKNVTYSKGNKVDWEKVVNSAVQGAIIGGILNAPGDVASIRNGIATDTQTKQENKQTKAIEINSATSNITPSTIITPTPIQTPQQTQVNSVTDNTGKPISSEVATKLQDSKIRDDKGNLLEVYHGTNAEFDNFDTKYLGSGSGDLGFIGDGIYFATHKGEAEYYGRNVKNVYLDVKNPFNIKELAKVNGKDFSGESSNSYVEIKNLSEMNKDWENIKINDTTFGNIKNGVDNYLNNVKIKDGGLAEDVNGNQIRMWEITYKGKEDLTQALPNLTKEEVLANNMTRTLRDEFGFINNNEIIEYITDHKRFDNGKSLADVLSEKGYDGVIQGEKASFTDEVVVFKPEQIIQPKTNLAATKESDVLVVKPAKQQVAESKKETDAKIAEITDKYETIEKTERPIWNIIKNKLVDKGYIFKQIGRAVKSRTLEAKYDNIISARGIADNMVGGDGIYDQANNKLSESLYTIFEPIEQSKKTKIFGEYMYHQLNIDRMSLDGKYGDNKPVFGAGVTADISKQKVAQFEKENPEFKTWAKAVYKYNEALLTRALETGIINQESFDYYKAKYPHYIPIKRIGVGNNAGEIQDNGRASVGNAIKTAKGGNQDLVPIKEAMALNTYSMTKAGQRNKFANELSKVLNTPSATETIDVDTTIEEIENDGEMLTAGDKTTTPTLTYFENGEKKTIAINTEMYEALKTTYIRDIKALSSISNLRRNLITEYNIAFMLTNPIKDIQDGLINSQYPKAFVKNLVEAAKQIKTKGPLYRMMMANGGNQNSYFNYDKGFVPPKNTKGIKGVITYPLRKISAINQFIEMTPRMSEFISSIEAGDSVEVAMYNAAEVTTNFKAGGDWAKLLNKNGATFLNASIQGAYKQVRNIQDAKSNGLKGVAHLLVRFTLAALPYHILNGLLWGDDDDYEQLSDYIKDNYYILGKYADGRFIKIPKGRVVGLLQKTVRSIGDTPKEGVEAWDGFLEQFSNSLAPNNPIENNIFSPLLQAATNKAWYGGELLPMRLKDKAPADQFDESTDELSKFIGKNLGISPYKINYVLDQYSGVIGDIGLPAITKEAEQGNGVLGKALSPLVDKFTTDSVLKNQKVSDFYDLTEKFRLAAQKEKATSSTVYSSKALNKNKAAISKLYKQKREIQLSDLPDKEKYNEAREIQKQINSIANDAIIQYKGKIGE